MQRCHSCVRVVAQHQANCKHQALCRDAEALPPGIEETPAAEFAANVPVLTAIAALNIGMCCAVLCCADRSVLRRLMPTVGCEADAIAFTEEDASSSSSSSSSSSDSSTESSSDSSSGLYYSADGSYSSGDFGAPAVLCGADLLHTFCCVKLLRELCKPILMERDDVGCAIANNPVSADTAGCTRAAATALSFPTQSLVWVNNWCGACSDTTVQED